MLYCGIFNGRPKWQSSNKLNYIELTEACAMFFFNKYTCKSFKNIFFSLLVPYEKQEISN